MKRILDATAGGRMMWWNKEHSDVLFVDRRVVPPGAIQQRPLWACEPDVQTDFTNLPFNDDAFEMVVFDPPHAPNATPESIIGTKYGTLEDIAEVVAGLRECIRVAESWVVFKWAEAPFTIGEVIELLNIEPLFGHRTAKSGATIWCVFDARTNPR